jgi:hypothetical protein
MILGRRADSEAQAMPYRQRLLRFGYYAFVISFATVAGLGSGYLFLLWLLFRGGPGIDRAPRRVRRLRDESKPHQPGVPARRWPHAAIGAA